MNKNTADQVCSGLSKPALISACSGPSPLVDRRGGEVAFCVPGITEESMRFSYCNEIIGHRPPDQVRKQIGIRRYRAFSPYPRQNPFLQCLPCSVFAWRPRDLHWELWVISSVDFELDKTCWQTSLSYAFLANLCAIHGLDRQTSEETFFRPFQAGMLREKISFFAWTSRPKRESGSRITT